ncbi:MAG: UvrD-helicase domain-containing protein [Draconibacterium sp.]
MLTVYKASAGSGKTFQLVVEYITLLLENPQKYRHILAVTFTNKATNEMKTRILEQLNKLATNQPSDYIQHLQKDKNYTEGFIRERARQVLKNILHDYNRFSISTIDSFTQRTIKAFNREMGISPNFMLELDNEMILAEATDRLLAKIDKDKKLLKWLKSFSIEKIEDNRSQRIDDNIKLLGKELFKEKFQVFFPENGESVYSRKNLKEFGRELNAIISTFENSLKALAKKALNIIENNGFTIEDFSYGKSGVAGFFVTLSNDPTKEPGKRVTEAATETEKWYAKKSTKAIEIHGLADSQLQPLLNEILHYISTNEENYYTAVAIQKQFRTLGILTDLKEEIKLLLQEKGLLQLSDANLLLNKIIGKSDSPFIYEKTGSYYHHFMLDEFQDTSGLQWQNFKPLIINSLAEGNKNLLVGDVKQSIYRWRNSDWNILAEQINQDFRENQREEKPLTNNWRSDRNIIDFNNAVFESLKTIFEEIQFRAIDDPDNNFLQKFDKIYSSILQIPGKENIEKTGFVNIQFLPQENFYDLSAEQLVEQVKELQDKGITASEIAVLIRANREGAIIIEKFLAAAKLPENANYNLSVLSNESLFLFASQGVLMIVNTVQLLIDAENKIARVSLLNHWLYWLKPELEKQPAAISKNENFQFDFNDVQTNSWDDSFNLIFEKELATKLDEIKNKVLISSLDETVMQIASVFQLFSIETELPFIQTLIDKAAELKTSLSNDLSNFLFWWNEEGFKTSVSVNEEVDSIRLLTVHKSKGLEYKAVLIPFFNWKTTINGQNAPIHWVIPQTEPFNQFPLLPVQHGGSMKKSKFKFEYNEEIVSTFIDTFNLVYVAFTRAKSVLIINSPEVEEPKKESDSGKPIQYLLKKALERMAEKELFAHSFNKENTQFQLGEIPPSAEKTSVSNSLNINHYTFKDFSNRIKLHLSGEDFLVNDEHHQSVRNTGKIIHEILAEIKTAADIEKACTKALFDGKINEDELATVKEKLLKDFENPKIKSWFDGTYKVLNERSLLKTNKLLRPDRIMISGKTAIVVDYKTGEKQPESYNRQIENYAKTLKETGLDKVEGFLWYTQLNEIEKVCEYE